MRVPCTCYYRKLGQVKCHSMWRQRREGKRVMIEEAFGNGWSGKRSSRDSSTISCQSLPFQLLPIVPLLPLLSHHL
ncbi:hypothetical protein E2542_SST22409 [Spatholobus suberectus]|nr:hypothetical protein E2542_SST22409 [Spatholobus suberectus]